MFSKSRKLKELYYIFSNRKLPFAKLFAKVIFCAFGILFLSYIFLYLFICSPIALNDIQGTPRNRVLCMDFHGGIGNQFFHYAFAYSKAREKNLQLIIAEDNMLTKYFHVQPNTWNVYGYNRYSCWCFFKYYDSKFHCGFDAKFENLPNGKDLAFHGYFQSWRYWKKYEPELRRIFQFKPQILKEARTQLANILSSKGISSGYGKTIIGVHIRKFTPYETDVFGKQYAARSYIINAMDYYKKRFPNCLFLVCANDITWAKEMVPESNDIFIVEGNSGIVDMALLTLTNHTLMTVGTYGWVISWMTNGTTLYYKHPDKPGSPFSKLYSNYSDHFYPGWIAME